MQELSKFNLKVNVTPNALEKYMSISINNKPSFIDSFPFLSSLLDSLVKNLAKYDFKYMSQEFDNNVLDLVKQKEFEPFEYVSDFEKFKEQLGSKETLYSSLTGKKISDKEYEHVLKVCSKFAMKTIKGYHNFYLKCDVLLLADVFEKFRNNSLKNYGLCPSHYLSAPALSWDAILNMTKVELELIPSRGGFSYIYNRYSKASNKYLKSYDPKQESKHIIYLDVNNLYGYAMSKFLPASGK